MKKLLIVLLGTLIFTGCATVKNLNTSTPSTEPILNIETPEEEKDLNNKKVIATSVSVVEILDKLGVETIGIPTSSYLLPENVKNSTEVGAPMSPNMEIIKSLNPDIVFSVTSLEPTLSQQFTDLNIESSFVNLSSYDGLIESIKIISDLTNTSINGSELIEATESRMNLVSEKVKDKNSPSVLIIFGASGSFQVATETSYVGDLVKRAGGTNIVQGIEGSFTPVDMEYLSDKNPEYILLMTHANPEESKLAFDKEFETNRVWNNFDAIKNNKVIALDSLYFGMSGNILAPDALEKLEVIFYE